MSKTFSNAQAIKALQDWYVLHYRVLPWRQRPGLGRHENPYHVFLSEFMLQQTGVKTVISYFDFFIKNWPKLQDLAKSSQDEIMAGWAGLGYYSRARNMHKAANKIIQDYQGQIPEDEAILQSLAGIGPYTAAAISAIAFDRPAIVLDGNIERILARLFNVTIPLPLAKAKLRQYAKTLTPIAGNGDHVQALMDLGSKVCKPKAPDCPSCPLLPYCIAGQKGVETASALPIKIPKPQRPELYGRALLLKKQDELFLIRRPNHGLLSGTLALPSDEWIKEKTATYWDWQEFMPYLQAIRGQEVLVSNTTPTPLYRGEVKHVFTHFTLYLSLFLFDLDKGEYDLDNKNMPRGQWLSYHNIEKSGLSSLMNKAIKRCFTL